MTQIETLKRDNLLVDFLFQHKSITKTRFINSSSGGKRGAIPTEYPTKLIYSLKIKKMYRLGVEFASRFCVTTIGARGCHSRSRNPPLTRRILQK